MAWFDWESRRVGRVGLGRRRWTYLGFYWSDDQQPQHIQQAAGYWVSRLRWIHLGYRKLDDYSSQFHTAALNLLPDTPQLWQSMNSLVDLQDYAAEVAQVAPTICAGYLVASGLNVNFALRAIERSLSTSGYANRSRRW